MIHYLKAFFLVAMAGNAVGLFLKMSFDLATGKVPPDKRLGAVMIAILFPVMVSTAIWFLRKGIPNGKTDTGKKAYRTIGLIFFVLFCLLGINEWLNAKGMMMNDKYLFGAGLLVGALILERISPWLRSHYEKQKGT